jgi:hypothetical protein
MIGVGCHENASVTLSAENGQFVRTVRVTPPPRNRFPQMKLLLVAA